MADRAFSVTQAENVLPFPSSLVGQTETQTLHQRARNIAAQVAELRDRATVLGQDLAETHHESVQLQLRAKAQQLVRSDPRELLRVLSDQGFAWRDVARMLGVSVPAIRKWRGGEVPTGEHRMAIARLLAFSNILVDDLQVFEPASWLEVPLVDGLPISGIDFYVANRIDLLYDVAVGNVSAETAMDEAFPGWTDRVDREWATGTAADGQAVIVPRRASSGAGDL